MKVKDAFTNLNPIFAQALAPFVDPDFFVNCMQSTESQPAAEPQQQSINESISNEIRPV